MFSDLGVRQSGKEAQDDDLGGASVDCLEPGERSLEGEQILDRDRLGGAA